MHANYATSTKIPNNVGFFIHFLLIIFIFFIRSYDHYLRCKDIKCFSHINFLCNFLFFLKEGVVFNE
jgi:hypothetical protein